MTAEPKLRRAVVICGLIRDAAKFAAYLKGLACLDQPGLRVVFSTWQGELAGHPEIAGLLAKIGADTMEQTQPNLKLPGHMLHQTMTLELGLSLLDDDVFVLKTRPDICGIMDVHEFLDLEPQRALPGRLAASFGHRVHVVGMFAAHPLYINDIVFAGKASDLRRLCWLPFIFGLKYPRLAPEQWLWATALAAGNPVLDAFLSVNPGLIFEDAPRQAMQRAVLTASPLFAKAIAVSAILMRDTLAYLHPDPHHATVVAACADHSLETLLWGRADVPGLEHHPTARTNTFLSAGLMDAVHDGLHAPSPFGERVQQAMARYGEPGGAASMQSDRYLLNTEAADLAAALSTRLGLPSNQATLVEPRSHKVVRAPEPWSIRQAEGDHVANLEREVNHLRRTVDHLQKRLNDAACP